MKLDTRLRFAYIETRLYWEDGLNAKDLTEVFDLTRQTAQAVLNQYRELHPEQMVYSHAKKRHIATEDFTPHYISAKPMEFLNYLRGQNLRAHYLDVGVEAEWSELEIEDMERSLYPQLSRDILRRVLGALRHHETLHIYYRNKMDEGVRTFLISPNYLAFAGHRYHLHAYSHVENKYLDFVLTRILAAETTDEDWVPGEGSEEWRSYVKLRFYPNPELSASVQKSLLLGYAGGDKGYREVSCRKNIALYIKREFHERLDDNSQTLKLWDSAKTITVPVY